MENLLRNASFESWSSGLPVSWEKNADATITQVTGWDGTGSAVQFSATTGGNGTGSNRFKISPYVVFLNKKTPVGTQFIRYSARVRRVSGSGHLGMGSDVWGTVIFAPPSNGTWYRTAFSALLSNGNTTTDLYPFFYPGTAGEVFEIDDVQVEDVTGQTNQNPSEYVSTGVKPSAPYHGANVDGVKYFATQNGNTVSSNIVTEAMGTALPTTTLKGYLAEGSRTNLQTYSDQLDLWPQVGTSVTVANTAVSPDGTMTADTLTDDDTGAYESVTGATVTVPNDSSAYVLSLYVKKTSGATAKMGVNMIFSGGTTTSQTFRLNTDTGVPNRGTVQDAGTWWRWTLSLANNASGNTSFNYSIFPAAAGLASSDDVINVGSVTVWGAQLEHSPTSSPYTPFASSYIPTTSASVTRARDTLTYLTAGNAQDSEGSAYGEFHVRQNNYNGRIIAAPTGATMLSLTGDNSLGSYDFATGGYSNIVSTVIDGNLHRGASSWNTLLNFRHASADGGIYTADTYDGTYFDPTISIGYGTTNSYLYGTIKNVKLWKKALTDQQLQNMTKMNDEPTARNAIKKTTVVSTPTDGLVGYWNFDEGRGTQADDTSTNNNVGTLTNGPTWVDGRNGKALHFSNADGKLGNFVTTPCLNLSRNSEESTSASFWINPLSTQTSANAPLILYSQTFAVGINTTAPFALRFRPESGGTTKTVILPSSILANQYTFVTVVFTQNKEVKFYINGKLKQTSPYPYITDACTGNFIIGGHTGAYNGIQADIDELRIYNKALSQNEITDIYTTSKKTIVNTSQNDKVTNGLVGLWSFNGPDMNWATNTAYDRSGQNNHGTITNMDKTQVTPGKVGQALRFDGSDDYIQVSDSGLPIGDSPRSIIAWIKTQSCIGLDHIVHYGSGNAGNSWGIVLSGCKLQAHEWYVYQNLGTVPLNQWTQVAIVLGVGGVKTHYINGVSVGTTTYVPNTVASGIMRIGSRISTPVEFFDGSIDEVRLYNRALSATEVMSLYTMGR